MKMTPWPKTDRLWSDLTAADVAAGYRPIGRGGSGQAGNPRNLRPIGFVAGIAARQEPRPPESNLQIGRTPTNEVAFDAGRENTNYPRAKRTFTRAIDATDGCDRYPRSRQWL